MRADFERIPLQPGESFACREFLLPRFNTPWHFHPELELTLVLSSTGERFVGDSIEPFGPGDLVLLGSNLPHYWHNEPSNPDSGDPAHSLVIQFRRDFLGANFFRTPELKPVAHMLDRSARGMQFPAADPPSLAGDIRALHQLAGPERLCGLLDILARLARVEAPRLLSTRGFVPQLDSRTGERMQRIYDHVLLHLGERIPLEEVAALVGMSTSSFCRYFRRVMGKTFVEFVNEIRIGQACRMLSEPEPSIAEIAYAVGYGSLSNFNRRFRELRAMSPRDYRRSLRRA